MLGETVQEADVSVVPSSPAGRAARMGSASRVDAGDLAALLAGGVPGSLRDAYQFGHPLLEWVIGTYPRAGDVWERLMGYAVGHAAEVKAGELSVERYRRTLDAIARDPDGRRHGRRVTRSRAMSPADMEQFPSPQPTVKRTDSLGPGLVAYVSAAVGWQLPEAITDVLEESTDLLVDLACHVAKTRGEAFDMGVLVDRSTWGRWRASSVLGHLPDRSRRSVEHIVCGHPKVAGSSAIHLMHAVPADAVPVEVIVAWRGDLPGLHPKLQDSYGRAEIGRARLGTPPSEADIVAPRPSHLAI